ncbi:FKBP-type peptidyl-prolyl cis-trans isomerase [Altererythrobacter ishigakiensis]|uniref:Peptidyl-prolyl cis-trans isomerase n=1 Tax=Altererythrobacter ishigakiensis TaxID=476157 RepID=A0A562UUX3_9SPHN|nr:FKBP-type peptidyl-prolyl cis-trans isomerase [Altererythrobacter ishigakiensis]TWJ09411.1 FKBP-type peptidyl-prolyl cis-trans isomerase FkpA [Altererythrobacter ishigakiensis]
MAEVTRVPIQPIAKGSLTKLWVGVIIAVLIGAGIAWAALPKAFSVTEVTAGTGAAPNDGDVAFIKYKGTLDDGTVFDEASSSPFPPGIFPDGVPMLVEKGAVVDGFYEGLKQMQKGGTYELFIPAELAYGDAPPPGSDIPPGANLNFEVELVDFMSQADAERRIQMLQQMMPPQGPGAAQPPQP